MEIRKPKIKSLPYNEWKDNDTLSKMASELNDGGTNLVLGNLDQLINWGRSNSLWSLTFATSCCGIEFMSVGCARYDFSRFGFEVTRNSPRQADLIMCAGTITNKMAPALKRLYDQMAEPKYVIAVGGCAISGGPFKDSYHVMRGIDEIIPVDVYIPGCPPRPEAIIYGMMQLQRKVKVEKFFGGVNHKQTSEERELGKSNSELIFDEKLGIRPEEIKEKREAAWDALKNPAPKPARPVVKPTAAAKPADAPAKVDATVTPSTESNSPKKETIVVNQPVTKEDVEKLGKEIDQIDAASKTTDETSTNN
ncbi:NADH-quinone oxidoreductase subunit B [Prevotella scopos JCM 17725]|jgi:NADH-quinone oxidoreductase, B subunit|uniref:NADH-quinone oxidoreductase subunit B n=1 Tax=Prevotella scopos JCM 17725 TaxID=1236518 RepID=A0AAX2F433_9BACT|nr:NADH-quinone oxidoreductase subunit B [Prevotella scopos]ANR72926.1 NADH dehydrogenase [Prevotella scopos JCM 17725]MBF1603340.1 NADH-quinone oxidoreductase subunit B [Prevotella sp.]QUB46185.1 NADH-quinone oxidoreductase subunit B [Prevotella scopos JCM 17725]SHF82784.1 NADH-quinone oxidoreductase subunit B [Prevotella scopos JCM 17725]